MTPKENIITILREEKIKRQERHSLLAMIRDNVPENIIEINPELENDEEDKKNLRTDTLYQY